MSPGSVARLTLVLSGALLAGLPVGSLAAEEPDEPALRQIQAILADKARWTPSERKLDTSLLMAWRQSRGRAMVQGLGSFPAVASRAGVGEDGRVVVDVQATVSEDLLRTIEDIGGQVISAYPSYGAVRARVPVERVDAIAALPEVRRVGPEERFVLNAGAATSEGDAGHAADVARSMFGVDGTGVRVGVLSDGVGSLAARQATGDLPPTCADPPPASGSCVAVLPTQAGSGSEGTAMLEIVHDLAPGAQLFFATADGGPAAFASNILGLRNAFGCDIIVDDVSYVGEGAFQDGPIAQAVSAVTAAGAIYFSAAGNSGRLSAGTSGTWEGDFVDSGRLIEIAGLEPASPAHSFNGLKGAGAEITDALTDAAPFVISLEWSDPLGRSTNDYDLFRTDAAFSAILDFSIGLQDGSQDPFEVMGGGGTGQRILILKYSGAARALRVETFGGRLAVATAGAVFGHNAADGTISVAATDGRTPGAGQPFTGGTVNPVETYSSDGPRRMFYNPNGTAITPGNVLFATNGGLNLKKPDVTAADCVTTAFSAGSFNPFCGTSAAAPHAAAVAALLESTPNHPSGGQALAAMFATALDVDPAGRDRDAGFGIVMAASAASALVTIPATDFHTLVPCRVFDTRQAGGPTGGAPLLCGLDRTFTVVGGACGVPGTAKAVSLNVTVADPTSQGNLRVFASGTPAPVVSTLNYVAGVTRANDAVARLGATGQIAVRCAPMGTTHVIVDVNGYFQ